MVCNKYSISAPVDEESQISVIMEKAPRSKYAAVIGAEIVRKGTNLNFDNLQTVMKIVTEWTKQETRMMMTTMMMALKWHYKELAAKLSVATVSKKVTRHISVKKQRKTMAKAVDNITIMIEKETNTMVSVTIVVNKDT